MHKFLKAYYEMRTKQRSLSKGGSMKEHFDIKIYILGPLLTKQIPKLKASWGKQFEKGTRIVKKLYKKEEMRKERSRKAKRMVESKIVKYIHQEDYINIAGNCEYRENIDILLYRCRRSRVRRAKCMTLRPKYRPLHTLGICLRFWKVFCKILSAG
jgi:hypothetical protein